jgi:hypothetical protein
MSNTIGEFNLGFDSLSEAQSAINSTYLDVEYLKGQEPIEVTKFEIADSILDTILNWSTQEEIRVVDLRDFIDTIVSQLGTEE